MMSLSCHFPPMACVPVDVYTSACAVLRNSLDITPEEPDKGLVSGSRAPERGEQATQKRLPLLTMTSYHLLAPNSDVAEGGLMLGLIPNPRLRPAVELWGKHFGTLKKLKLQFIYFLGRALFVHRGQRTPCRHWFSPTMGPGNRT